MPSPNIPSPRPWHLEGRCIYTPCGDFIGEMEHTDDARFVADADGDLSRLDDWIEEECGPAERNAEERVEISTNVGAEICVFLRDLARALDAAYRLGGADALRIGRDQLRLDGAGFTVVVCRALPTARAFRRFLVERGAEQV